MHALIGDQLLDGDIGLLESGVGDILVAHRPLEDMVVVLARTVRAVGLVLDIFAQHRRIRIHRLEWIDQRRQRFVLDFDRSNAVIRRVAIGRHHEGDFLILKQHLAVGEHHLHVTGQRRHPGEVHRLQRLGGDHRENARHFQSLL